MAKWRDSGDEPKERENECLAIEEKDGIKIQQNTENGDETRGRQNEGEAKKEKKIRLKIKNKGLTGLRYALCWPDLYIHFLSSTKI